MELEKFLKQKTYGSFINGSFLKGQYKVLPLKSPLSKQEWIGIIPAERNTVDEAIEAAQNAFKEWKLIPSPIRGQYLRKVGDALIAYKEPLAHTMAMEMGKPVSEGMREVHYAAGFFHWFAGEAERIYGLTIPSQFPDKRLQLAYTPVGVCGIITPWNFPLAMAARKIAAALAAGCTVVCKPSPECPLTLLILSEICRQLELPPGVMNVLAGDEELIGQALLESLWVRKISFTGSCEVGKYLYQRSAETLKKVTLELGGHAPLLVFNDANIEAAVQGTITAKFRNNGQTCVAPNRILVQEDAYEAYSKKLLEQIRNLKIGDPLDPRTDLSNVLHPTSAKKIQEHVQDALFKGAKAEVMGKNPYEPAVLSNVNFQMRVCREETFGPVLPLLRFKTIEEGITIANATEYGLASYVFTENIKTVDKVINDLEFGIIGINDGLPSTPQGSFGGVKNSGFGREGGPTGIYEYLNEKYTSICI